MQISRSVVTSLLRYQLFLSHATAMSVLPSIKSFSLFVLLFFAVRWTIWVVFPPRSWCMGTTRGVWTPSGDFSSHSFVDGKVPFHQPAVATNLFLLLSHLTSFLIPFSLSHYTQNKVQRIFKEIINQDNFIAGFYGKILCNSYQGQGL